MYTFHRRRFVLCKLFLRRTLRYVNYLNIVHLHYVNQRVYREK